MAKPSRERYLKTVQKHIPLGFATIDDVLSKSRHQPFVIIRWRAWRELYKSGMFSLPGIAKAAGGYDHTSILHGIVNAHKYDDIDITNPPYRLTNRRGGNKPCEPAQ